MTTPPPTGAPTWGPAGERNLGHDPLSRQRRSGIGATMENPSDGPADTDPTSGLDLELHADRLREECGVFGIYGHPDAAAITALGLHALQHRGQEAAGIVSYDGKRFHSERRLGLVGDTFSRRDVIDRLPGSMAV